LAEIYNTVYYTYQADVASFIAVANFQPGKNVLDLGTGSGWVIIKVKRRVGNGACAGTDCVRSLMVQSAKPNIIQASFTTSSGVPAVQSIRIFEADITSAHQLGASRACLPPGTTGFDVITGLWVFDLLPWDHRSYSLRLWRDMLAPRGRLILHMRYQLQRADYLKGTECLASMTVEAPGPEERLPSGRLIQRQQAIKQVTVAIPAMWAKCQQQVQQLVQDYRLEVVSMEDANTGNDGICDSYDNQSVNLQQRVEES
ncbi:hypothetical protein K469DRAFT_613306, partial [Zopfia rhizophila CBS 207.26]